MTFDESGWRDRSVFGCVLIGGASRRMGRPKHLIEQGGETWLERTVMRLARFTSQVVIAGDGAIPASLAGYPQLPDVPGINGPVAGMLAAMRWAPEASWLVAACDMPDLSDEAVKWLLDTRAPGVWATLPLVSGRPEPLFAYYDPRAAALLESLVAEGAAAPRLLAGRPGVITPEPPSGIVAAWRNVNTAEASG